MSVRKKLIYICCIFVMAFILPIGSLNVYGEIKQKDFVTVKEQEDLTVVFSFDKEVVDITFISPSGVKKTASDADVEFASGDCWSSYCIRNAEKGTWKIEYDLKRNTEIEYSVLNEKVGIWIQYLNVGTPSADKMNLSFEADCEDGDIYYEYEIYAVDSDDATAVNKVASGSATANEEKTVEVSLADLSSGNYSFRLDAFYREGEAEIFDSVTSDPIDYNNPNKVRAIDDFVAKINTDKMTCEINWSDFAKWGCEKYKLIVLADGQEVYRGDLERDITQSTISYPKDAQSIEIKLAYKENIWSDYKSKTISLGDYQLSNLNGDVTSSAQVRIGYSVKKETGLSVQINEKSGSYKLRESGELAFDLEEGSNTLYAELETPDSIFYIIDTDIYYDVNPPEIKLYDKLDGKTFYDVYVTIIGKVSSAQILRIDGKEVELKEDGSFSYDVSLSIGENVVNLEAEDANGNLTTRVLTLYRGTTLLSNTDTKKGWIQFLPLLAALLTSLLIIVLSVAFMRRTDRNNQQRRSGVAFMIIWDILLLVAEGICVWQFVVRYRESNTMRFVELAEKSAMEAAKYMHWERIFGIASLAGFVIFIISIVITAFVIRHNVRARGNN